MKKTLLITMLCCCMTSTQIVAQNVYNEILRLSKAVANDTTKDVETRKIATFKVDELNYMAMKSNEVMPDSTVRMLDYQAYAMYDFINLYIDRLSKAKRDAEKEVIRVQFKNASINNSRFNDMDKDLVLSYYNRNDYLTQFSLDTDWVKAIEEIRKTTTSTE
jgi:hypothetical protein